MFLDPTFYAALSFILFCLVMGRPIYRTVVRTLDNRRDSIDKDIEQATQLRKEAEELLERTQRQQQDVFQQISGIKENAQREAETLASDAQKKVEELMQREEKRITDQITLAENQALKMIKQEAIYLAVLATEKILEKNLDPSLNDQLVEQALKDIQHLDFQSIH